MKKSMSGRQFNIVAIVAAACALSLGSLNTASASSTDASAPKLVVKYSPSSLLSDGGVRQLYRRLMSAAEKVCDPPVGRFASQAVIACRKQAVNGAVAQIHNKRLLAMAAGNIRIG